MNKLRAEIRQQTNLIKVNWILLKNHNKLRLPIYVDLKHKPKLTKQFLIKYHHRHELHLKCHIADYLTWYNPFYIAFCLYKYDTRIYSHHEILYNIAYIQSKKIRKQCKNGKGIPPKVKLQGSFYAGKK